MKLLRSLLIFLAFASAAYAQPIPTTQIPHVNSRTALAALPAAGFSTGDVAFLEEAGRSGFFQYTSSSIQTAVTADTVQCAYVARGDVTSGASGGWVRVYDVRFNVRWCGAIGDWNDTAQTGTDNYTAFTVAKAVMALNNAAAIPTRGCLYVPSGRYKIGTGTLDYTDFGACVDGDGPTASYLYPDHSAGCAVRFQKSYSIIRNIAIYATDARTAGSASGNCGVRFEPADSPGAAAAFQSIENVIIQDQPSHGLVCSACESLDIVRVDSIANGGHGFVVDNGQITSRVNTKTAGWITARNLRALNNGGHGLAAGSSADTSSANVYRLHITNLDAAGNVTDAAVRYTTDEVYLVGEGITLEDSGIGGADAHGALFIAGHNIYVTNNRFPDITRVANVNIIAGFTTDNVVISGMRVISAPSTVSPAVVVNASVTGYVAAYAPESTSINTVCTLCTVQQNDKTLTDSRTLVFPLGLSLSTPTAYTIATDAITITSAGYITLETESGAATDNLATISGGTTGMLLYVRDVDGTHDTTLKDGTGNLKLAADCVLGTVNDIAVLLFDGTNWLGIACGVNG